jgi:hypothetical protein
LKGSVRIWWRKAWKLIVCTNLQPANKPALNRERTWLLSAELAESLHPCLHFGYRNPSESCTKLSK